MKTDLDQLEHVYLVSITSKDCVNFKTALNHIVKNITEKRNNGIQSVYNEDEDDLKYDKRLRYDLDIVADWCRRLVKNDPALDDMSYLRIVISVDDADSFDVSILTSLIKMLHSYISYIPVKLILSVATSVEVFEEKLPRSSIRLLSGQSINACLDDGLITIIKNTIFQRSSIGNILLGPKLFKSLIQRQEQSLESIDAYISSLKYAYMSHYYSNPFACIHECMDKSLDVDNTLKALKKVLTPSHCQALRLLGSFRDQIESSLPQMEPSHLESLLTNDDHLIYLTATSIHEFAMYKKHMLYGLHLMTVMQDALREHSNGDVPDFSILSLYPSVLTGEIKSMKIFEDLKSAISNSRPEILAKILFELEHFADPPRFSELASHVLSEESLEVIDKFVDRSGPEYFAIPGSMDERKSVIQYAKLQNKITDLIFTELAESFCSYRRFFLHEAFIVDTATLQENVFMPTHRGAIEMALSNPKHYWGDVLTNTMTNKLATDEELNPNDMSSMGSDPHLCIMYTLYRESNVFINIYDWYTTFSTILKKPEEEDPHWEKKVLSWFLQGVAELKFLGIIRDSKRKFECVEKLVWRGL